MIEVVEASRPEQLKALLVVISKEIDRKPGARDLAGLCKQYRDTVREIEEIEGVREDDEIGEILKGRKADGKSDSVRSRKTKV